MRVYCPSRKEFLETAAEPLAPPGAEGSVFSIPAPGFAGIVAKIFVAPSADDRRAKVETLINHPFHDPPAKDGHRRFAAPQEILLDHATGEFVGYTMPLIPNADALDEFFDPQGKRYRRDKSSFRVGLAIAVAELVCELHRHELDITIADLKPHNILNSSTQRGK
jgi:DNA-binding helix-hairpin-helix protein with protein kinase domain